MTKYDPQVIQKFADKLYSKSATTTFIYTLVFAIIGLGAGFALSRNSNSLAGAMPLTLILGAIGYAIGREKSFQYRLQAQIALCQVKIEENTRLQKDAAS